MKETTGAGIHAATYSKLCLLFDVTASQHNMSVNYSQNSSRILLSVTLVCGTAETPRHEIESRKTPQLFKERMRPASVLIFPSNCSIPDSSKYSLRSSLSKPDE